MASSHRTYATSAAPRPPLRVTTSGSSSTAPQHQFVYDLPAALDSPRGKTRHKSPPPPHPRAPYSRRGSSSDTASQRSGANLISPTYRKNDGPSEQSLQVFAQHCRLFYFSPSPPSASAAYISSTLSNLPPSHRAAYTRLQSALRSEAHTHHLRLRLSAFHALISSTVANASLTPRVRGDLRGPGARLERLERLERFVETWGGGRGTTEPFIKGLRGVLRLQSRRGVSERVNWEVDDAVFMESGGTEFMHEAITTLKGVLGFTDVPLAPPPLLSSPTPPAAKPDARSRATSDPFIDSRYPSAAAASHGIDGDAADLNAQRFRVWTFPSHISDEEAEDMLAVLAKKVQAKDVRFPFVRPGYGIKDAEAGRWTVIHGVKVPSVADGEEHCGVVRYGTGRIWLGEETRDEGWQGGAWFRFKRWWRRLFGMAWTRHFT